MSSKWALSTPFAKTQVQPTVQRFCSPLPLFPPCAAIEHLLALHANRQVRQRCQFDGVGGAPELHPVRIPSTYSHPVHHLIRPKDLPSPREHHAPSRFRQLSPRFKATSRKVRLFPKAISPAQFAWVALGSSHMSLFYGKVW